MFWTEDINELFKPVLIPTDYMSFDEKLNSLTRLIIFVSIILALILRDTKILLLMILLIIIVFIIYNYQKKYKFETDSFLNKNTIDIIDNKICVKPTKNNPFMNPNLTDINLEEDVYGACSISNSKIINEIDNLYETSMFQNVDDIYNTQTSSRQFYTIPSSKIPNDQTLFANWLYNRGPTCKENNGIVCYNNLYKDLRI